MAGSEQLLGAAQQEGFMIAPAASTNKWALYREGLAAAALQELASRYEEEQALEDCPCNKEKLVGNIRELGGRW